MRLAVIGLGSMGRRRIRLSQAIDPSIDIIGVDSNNTRVAEVAGTFDIRTVASLEKALELEPDCVLVCTSPLAHSSILNELVERDIPAFTELNLIPEGYDYFIDNEIDGKLFLSSTFLYRRDVQRIVDTCSDTLVNYVYHSGQYLPDWHPWESFKDYFVGNKLTNGCREILAIELPWLLACFGPVVSLTVHKDSISGLGLDYPDSYQLMLEHENGSHGVLAVDVVSRKPTRSLSVYGENIQVEWEGTPDSLSIFNAKTCEMELCDLYGSITHDDRYAINIIEDAYEDELRAFFAWVERNDRSEVRYSFAEDTVVLGLIDRIEGDL